MRMRLIFFNKQGPGRAVIRQAAHKPVNACGQLACIQADFTVHAVTGVEFPDYAAQAADQAYSGKFQRPGQSDMKHPVAGIWINRYLQGKVIPVSRGARLNHASVQGNQAVEMNR
jgi:hypothetical protein